MSSSKNKNSFHRPAFTLMELMVSVAILVLIILSVGVIFQSASKSVGVSQASMEMLSNVQAIQNQIERDVSGLSKDGFLVIRSAVDTSVTPNRRFDQVAFISYGSFANRTGAQLSTNPFTDNTVTPAAIVWWGQLAVEKLQTPAPAVNDTDPKVYLQAQQNVPVPLDQVPNGVNPQDFILGRHTTLLFGQQSTNSTNSPNGIGVAYYQSQPALWLSAADYNAATVQATSKETVNAHISKSRIDTAASTPEQVMSFLQQYISHNGGRSASPNQRCEADHFCFRFATLNSPFDSEVPNVALINGLFRMHPIAMKGVSSFAVEWTDGTIYTAGNPDPVRYPAQATAPNNAIPVGDPLVGTTRWYGYGNSRSGTNSALAAQRDDIDGPTNAFLANGNGQQGHNDVYTAIFSYDTPRANWPVALRFRYHVEDPTGRLPGGRDFVQVVKLPQ